MIFTIDRLLDNDAYQYHINPHHSNISINLESEFFMPHHFELQVGKDAPMAMLQFTLDGMDSRLEVTCNPFQLKPEPTENGVKKCVTATAVIGNKPYEIKYCQAKGKGFFGGYFYYEIETDGNNYKIYDVNQGAKGRYLCVYMNDRLVAMAKWTGLGYTGTIYTVYSEDNIDPHILTLLVMYSDVVILRNDDNQNALVVVMPKEIRNKYNPDFIDRITKQDEGK